MRKFNRIEIKSRFEDLTPIPKVQLHATKSNFKCYNLRFVEKSEINSQNVDRFTFEPGISG